MGDEKLTDLRKKNCYCSKNVIEENLLDIKAKRKLNKGKGM